MLLLEADVDKKRRERYMVSNQQGIIIGLVVGLLVGASAAYIAIPAGTTTYTISSSGSTTVLPLSLKWSSYLPTFYPSLALNVKGGGSGIGQSDAAAGTVDIGASSSYPSASWRTANPTIKILPISADALGIVVNTHVNASMKMDCDMVVAVFQRNVTTWEAFESTFHVNVSATGNINVYVRSDASGTTATFTKWLQTANITANPYANYTWKAGSSEAISWPAGVNAVDGNPGVASGVKSDQNGIGYVGLAFMEDLVPVHIYNPTIGQYVEPTVANALKALPTVITNPGVNLFNSANSGAYPLCRLLFYLVNPSILKWYTIMFLDWCLTQGQQYIPDVGYLPIVGTSAGAYADTVLAQMTPAA
jgi:phosphate transport system substrate-binding protein